MVDHPEVRVILVRPTKRFFAQTSRPGNWKPDSLTTGTAMQRLRISDFQVFAPRLLARGYG